ncbi:MAG: hypothetical protein IJS08_02615 [Victivallales bacterium]|nr:hypothetical protein [Victivallales bacterium]
MRIFIIALILPLISLQADTLDWLAGRHDNGVWYNEGRGDYICSLLALDLLERSGEAKYAELVRAGRRRLSQDGGASLYPTLARCIVNGSYGDLSLYFDHGFCNEEGAFPDLLSTLWCCHLLNFREGIDEVWLEGSVEFIYDECLGELEWGLSAEGNQRLGLFVLWQLLLMDEPIAAEALEHVRNVMASDNVELALQLGIMCACGEWEEALVLRGELLSRCNEDGSWPEQPGKSGDLLASCLALEVLDAFTVAKASAGPDLDVPLDAVTFKNGEMRFLLFNNGDCAALPCLVEVEWHDGEGLLSKEEFAVARMERRHALSFTARIPANAELAVIKADVAGVSGDVDWTNNICYVPLVGNVIHSMEIAPLLAAGKDGANPLFLGAGLGVMLTGAIAHNGQCAEIDLTWELLDNDKRLYAGNGHGRIEVEWFPLEGWHELALKAQCHGVENTRKARFEVVYDVAVLKTYKIEAQQTCDIFSAREYVEIQALSSYTDCDVEMRIYSPQGMFLCKAAKDFLREGYWQWHTGDCSPGMYKAEAIFRKGGIVLAKAEKNFEILPTFQISDLKIEEPILSGKLYERQDWQEHLTFSWNCIANVQREARIEWHIEDAEGRPHAFGRGEMQVAANTGRLLQCSSVPSGIGGRFEAYGVHTLKARLSVGEDSIEASLPINVLKRPVISINSTVSPKEIDTGSNMLRTTIRLEGDASVSRGEPASFSVEDEPIMLQDNKATMRLVDVRDAYGNLVEEGVLLCSVPYGKLSGGVSLSEAGRVQGDLLRVQVSNGVAELEYNVGEVPVSSKQPVPIYISVRKEGTNEMLGSIGVFCVKREE